MASLGPAGAPLGASTAAFGAVRSLPGPRRPLACLRGPAIGGLVGGFAAAAWARRRVGTLRRAAGVFGASRRPSRGLVPPRRAGRAIGGLPLGAVRRLPGACWPLACLRGPAVGRPVGGLAAAARAGRRVGTLRGAAWVLGAARWPAWGLVPPGRAGRAIGGFVALRCPWRVFSRGACRAFGLGLRQRGPLARGGHAANRCAAGLRVRRGGRVSRFASEFQGCHAAIGSRARRPGTSACGMPACGARSDGLHEAWRAPVLHGELRGKGPAIRPLARRSPS